MSLNPLKREIYDYIRIHGEVTLDELCEQFDTNDNNVYGAAKHLKRDGYLDADTGNNVWQTAVGIPGLCPECGDETEWNDNMEQECPDCGWEETWTCRTCGSTDPHHAMLVMDDELEVDVTCKSVYVLPADGGDGFAFSHEEFDRIMEHYEQRPDYDGPSEQDPFQMDDNW